MLRQIGVTIQNYEREHIAERSITHGEQPDIHEERRLPDSRSEPEQQPKKPLGKYGRMRKAYLKEHRPLIYNHLLMSEKLYPHLLEIEGDGEQPSGADDAPAGGVGGRDGGTGKPAIRCAGWA